MNNKIILTIILLCFVELATFGQEVDSRTRREKFEDYLLWLTVRFFKSKFNPTAKYKKSLKYMFFSELIVFMKSEFPAKWKHFVRVYQTKENTSQYKLNYYLTSKALIKIYLYTPNWLKSVMSRIIRVLSKIKKR